MGEAGLLELRKGAIFQGRYEVQRCIKAGGMGAVYEVLDTKTDRRRALKVMLPGLVSDPDLRARFQQEAKITAYVESEHLVEIFDAGTDEETGVLFLVMELLKGEDLGDILERQGRLPPVEALLFLDQAALVLDRTHAAGIIHRDLKPENLFVTRRDDGSPRLRVLDFGIAKLRAQSGQATKTTRNLGTPLYMSPEQVRGDGSIDHRADLYSLGHIAYALLVGEAYWEKEAAASGAVYPLLAKIVRGATEPASVRARTRGVALPAGFDAWFAKAMAMAPRDRFHSASELVEELARVVDAKAHLASTHPMPARATQAEAAEAEPVQRTAPMDSQRTAPMDLQRTLPFATQRTIPIAPQRTSARRRIGAVILGCTLVAGAVLVFVRRGLPDAGDSVNRGTHDPETASAPSFPLPMSTAPTVVPASVPTPVDPAPSATSEPAATRPSAVAPAAAARKPQATAGRQAKTPEPGLPRGMVEDR